MNILENTTYKCSVSSVLNRDVKQHGRQFMFDAKEDTSWSSNEGVPQWINVQFSEPQAINAFSFQFQGGFAGKNAKVVIEAENGEKLVEDPFYPEDINSEQIFKLKHPVMSKSVRKVKFIFDASTDFFGRIIVYKLKIY